MDDDLVALLFGAAIVIFFAYDRFNSAGYEGSQQFERLVAYLSPDKMRTRRVILRAYLVYATILVAIYLFLCTYAGFLPQLGAQLPPGASIGASRIGADAADAAGGTPSGLVPSASTSLAVALIMVGLAPSFPVLERFEHWMRSTAHRLAGIPTRVIEAADILRHARFAFDAAEAGTTVPSDTLLIRRSDWQRMVHYQKAAAGALAAPEDFRDDLEKIFAVSAWILDRKLKLSGAQDRLRFQPLESALRKRSEALVQTLDDKSAFARSAAEPAQTAPASGAAVAAGSRGGWERLARDVDELADDFCVLLALYVEHEIITPGGMSRAAAPPDGSAPGKNASRHQHDLARSSLETFLDLRGERPSSSVQSHVMVAGFWTLGVVLAASLAWSVFPGALEDEMQRGSRSAAASRARVYVFVAFSTYCIPMLVALAIRDGGLQYGRWISLWSGHWTLKLPQTGVVVLASWAFATLFLVALMTWLSSALWVERPGKYVLFQIGYMAPSTLRGAMLAWIVLMLLDAQLDSQIAAQARARADAPKRAVRSWPWHVSLLWAILAAVLMALCGAVTRYLSGSAAAQTFGRTGFPDEVDRGLIIYAALSSGLIAFLVVFCVSEAVQNFRGGFRRHVPVPVPAAAAPAPPPPQVTAE